MTQSAQPPIIIVQVKEGLFIKLFGLSCGSVPFFASLLCGIYQNKFLFLFPFIIISFVVWLVVLHIIIKDIRHPKSATLSLQDGHLVWTIRMIASGKEDKHSIPLKSLSSLELVSPAKRGKYSLATLVLVDIHGNRHQLPSELWPGVYHKKIIAALKHELPEIMISERTDDEEKSIVFSEGSPRI